MPVSWSPLKVGGLALLDVAVSALPLLLWPLDDVKHSTQFDTAQDGPGGGGEVPYSQVTRLVAIHAAANALGGVAVAYARPCALCPCHALSVGDLVDHTANGLAGVMLSLMLLAALVCVISYNMPMAVLSWRSGGGADQAEPAEPWLLPGLCLKDRLSVELSALVLLGSHSSLPLAAATRSNLSSVYRVVVRLSPGGPLEATVLGGVLGLAAGCAAAACMLLAAPQNHHDDAPKMHADPTVWQLQTVLRCVLGGKAVGLGLSVCHAAVKAMSTAVPASGAGKQGKKGKKGKQGKKGKKGKKDL